MQVRCRSKESKYWWFPRTPVAQATRLELLTTRMVRLLWLWVSVWLILPLAVSSCPNSP